ncbi:putative inner membrane protein [Yersinia nurmii]|uniref:Inner membrane protein n=1 Tax=Yersinia nurmii TaxID=685706 RepID=A0ABM9SMQ1_9GAMM|nr:YqjD family protein [Yersinia nurmii]CNF20870.1 putative inner membrane protein [Yersinia nurmii]
MFKKSEKVERNIDQDVNLLADTLDDVLRSSGDKTKEELEKVRQNAEGVLRDARARFSGSTSLTQHARDVAGNADSYVRDKPWQGVGIGAAVGVVLGVLLSRR